MRSLKMIEHPRERIFTRIFLLLFFLILYPKRGSPYPFITFIILVAVPGVVLAGVYSTERNFVNLKMLFYVRFFLHKHHRVVCESYIK